MVAHSFGSAVQQTNLWLHDVMAELATDNPERAYTALRATLHALRDRLTVAEAAHLSAQLPMLVRGFYFEGWRPAGVPARIRRKDAFLAEIARECRNLNLPASTEQIARAVFRVLGNHVSGGEIEDIKRVLPEEIRELWPEARPEAKQMAAAASATVTAVGG